MISKVQSWKAQCMLNAFVPSIHKAISPLIIDKCVDSNFSTEISALYVIN